MLRVLFIITLLCASLFAREEAWEEELQYEARIKVNMMLKGLDAPYDRRESYVKSLVNMARGKLHTLVLKQLTEAMKKGNTQVTEGIIEVITRIDDISKIPTLENELLYNQAIDVRLSIIQHLPVFCVPSAQERAALLELLESGERNLPQRLVQALRVQPINPKTNEYDILIDEDVRGRIENTLTWQLNPVEAVIEFGLEKRQQDRALDMLKYLIGLDLGYQKKVWIEFWRSRGRNYISPVQDEMLETEINSCRMLGFMGAEGTPLLCDNIRWLVSTPFPTARHAALEMLAEVSQYAQNNQRKLSERLQKKGISQAEEQWVKRRQQAAMRLVSLTLELAEKYNNDESESIRIALLKCLGATQSQEATKYIEQALRISGKSHNLRLHAIAALGEISSPAAGILLQDMAVYRAIAVNRELQIKEYQRIRNAYEALSQVIGHKEAGKLVYKNAEASKAAFNFILEQLKDTREIEGTPRRSKVSGKTVQFFAREVLRSSFGNNENSYQPEFWQKLYEQLRGAR